MASLDIDLVRHALQTARGNGYAEVELNLEGASFRAKLEPGAKAKGGKAEVRKGGPAAAPSENGVVPIKSTLVGFYREGEKPLAVGQKVNPGEVVAVVAALGIATDIEAKQGGEVVEVLVQEGDPVEFGQPLALVKTS
jgi:biotin carboxyl carrier protein